MQSAALALQTRLNHWINLDDLAFLQSLEEFGITTLGHELEQILDADTRQLQSELARVGLSSQYKRLTGDRENRTAQALLGARDRRHTRRQKLLHTVARVVVYRLVVLSLVNRIADRPYLCQGIA